MAASVNPNDYTRFALTFAGRRPSGETLLGCAYTFEQATKVVEKKDKLIVWPLTTAINGNGHDKKL